MCTFSCLANLSSNLRNLPNGSPNALKICLFMLKEYLKYLKPRKGLFPVGRKVCPDWGRDWTSIRTTTVEKLHLHAKTCTFCRFDTTEGPRIVGPWSGVNIVEWILISRHFVAGLYRQRRDVISI